MIWLSAPSCAVEGDPWLEGSFSCHRNCKETYTTISAKILEREMKWTGSPSRLLVSPLSTADSLAHYHPAFQ